MVFSRVFILCSIGIHGFILAAQTVPPPKPDTLILNDGEKLIGHLVRSSGSSVVFKSDLIGEITVDWSKIRELHTSGTYAVVEKEAELNRHSAASSVPRGTITVAGGKITIHPKEGAAPPPIPVAQAGHVLEESAFEKNLARTPGPFEAWGGAITAGASMVQATQQSRAFSGAVHLVRGIPDDTWLPPRNRTLLDFSASEGFVVQPNTPKVKTEILHAGIERDEYFNASRVFGFGHAIFDHNYSQGLDLQQDYGGGLGWTIVQRPTLTLDLRGSANYVKQQFHIESAGHNLIASTFSQNLARKFPRGMVFLQELSVTPTWNELRAWLATASGSFTAPVYKRLSFTIGVEDNFLNDPPPGFRKNSFQATTGLTYTLR